MPFHKVPNAEPIPGYRLLAPLGTGGFGEVWKCEAPGGIFKAIKFVPGNVNGLDGGPNQASEEYRAIQHVKAVRHPFLLSIDRIESLDGELMIVTELADNNLHELLTHCQQRGLPGIPREELLRYLGEAAEVLDLMNTQHGLQHLDVKPRNFLMVSHHVKVADFGLVTSLLGNKTGTKLGGVTPLYASPEVFQGQVSRSSDQYSLACCYIELLSGKLPFEGRNSRQLLLQHVNAPPDLSGLPEGDRPILERALAKDPLQRHASCAELIQLLCGTRPVTASDGDADELRNRAANSCAPTYGALFATRELATGVTTPVRRNGRLTDHDTPRIPRGLPTVPAALAGYQFLENQGSTLLADVWKCTTAEGKLRQVKFIYGFTGRNEEAVRRLRALHHPALPALEVIQSDPGYLVLTNDYTKETVWDRWQFCQARKLPGIPRIELLGYLRTVAEVLDYLYRQHLLYHLGLNPRQLLLADTGLQIGDYGIAHLFWGPAGQPIAERNSRYAAPELFERQTHRATDQFSLAILFQELLTGSHPFGGVGRGTGNNTRGKLQPNLAALPEGDRAPILKALDPDPQQRWPACVDLIRALEGSASDAELSLNDSDNALSEVVASPHQPPLPPPGGGTAAEELRLILTELIGHAGGAVPVTGPFDMPLLSQAGDELLHKFRVGLPIGSAQATLDAFRDHCNGQLVHTDERIYEFQMAAPTHFWRQLFGRQPSLAVNVQLARPHNLSVTPIDVTVAVRAVHCGKRKAARLVQTLGANLLESLRTFLLCKSEKRTQDRLLWPHPVEVCVIEADGSVGQPIICRGKDLSLSGVGFYLPHEVPTSHVLIRLRETPLGKQFTIPATLVRAQRCGDGWYDVGALFRLTALRKSHPELCLT